MPLKASTSVFSKDQCDSLLRAVVAALIADNNDPVIEIAVDKKFKYPKDFPKRKKNRYEGSTVISKVNARGVLKWLQDHGHTKFTTAIMRSRSVSLGMRALHLDVDFGD